MEKFSLACFTLQAADCVIIIIRTSQFTQYAKYGKTMERLKEFRTFFLTIRSKRIIQMRNFFTIPHASRLHDQFWCSFGFNQFPIQISLNKL